MSPFFCLRYHAGAGVPSDRLGVVDLIDNVEDECKQRHADQHAVIGLPEDCQIRLWFRSSSSSGLSTRITR